MKVRNEKALTRSHLLDEKAALRKQLEAQKAASEALRKQLEALTAASEALTSEYKNQLTINEALREVVEGQNQVIQELLTANDAKAVAESTSPSTSSKRRRLNTSDTPVEDVVIEQEEQQEQQLIEQQLIEQPVIEQQEQEEPSDKQTFSDKEWANILKYVDDDSVTAFACVCKQLRRVQQASGRKLQTSLQHYERCIEEKDIEFERWRLKAGPPKNNDLSAVSEDWCLWSYNSLKSCEHHLKTRRRIMNVAAFWGHLNALKRKQHKYQKGKLLFTLETCALACLGGSFEVVKWIRDTYRYPWDRRSCRWAAEEGHLEMLKYAHEHGCPLDEHTCYCAARGGHLEVLKYAHENKCRWDERTCLCAAEEGHLEVLKYAHEHGCPWDVNTCTLAAKEGHLEVLKYAHKKGCQWDEATCWAAAEGGHFEVLKYAHEKDCPWDEDTCEAAARGGHLEVLKYAHENNCPWRRVLICVAAAKGGHLEVLKYLRKKHCPLQFKTWKAAAECGHLEVLKYAHENGFTWKPKTIFTLAAKHGHLEVLKYAHENGGHWDKDTCWEAAVGGHLEVLKYLHENGCPWDRRTCWQAAKVGDMKMLKYAHENDCPWYKWTCAEAARGGHLDVLKYAHENGCPWDWQTCRWAAEEKHLEVLKYAYENGCPCDAETYFIAYRQGGELFKYLRDTCEETPWNDHGLCIMRPQSWYEQFKSGGNPGPPPRNDRKLGLKKRKTEKQDKGPGKQAQAHAQAHAQAQAQARAQAAAMSMALNDPKNRFALLGLPKSKKRKTEKQDKGPGKAPPKKKKVSNKEKLTQKDAIKYLTEVKERFKEKPNVYNKFLDIMKKFRMNKIDTQGVVDLVKTLFKGHKDLLLGINPFVPSGYEIRVGGPAQKKADSKKKPPSKASKKDKKPIKFNQAISYVKKIKKRFANDERVHKAFLKILNMYRQGKKDIYRVNEEVSVLFKDHPDLLKEFTCYLPDSQPPPQLTTVPVKHARRRSPRKRHQRTSLDGIL